MIYFDNNATTAPLPEVVEAVERTSRDVYANPSSVHQFGQQARHLVETARAQVAELVGARPADVIFTSGGTESINLALRSAVALHPQRQRIVTTTVEHSAVLQTCDALAAQGLEVAKVGVDEHGKYDQAALREALADEPALLSIQHANNETGVIQNVAETCASAREQGVIVHVDAVQSAGKIAVPCDQWQADFVSLSAHKFHGPKGIGALVVNRRATVQSIITGGSQERNRRGGTENVPGIVGMGVAAEHARRHQMESAETIGPLRDRFERGVLSAIDSAVVNGGAPRLFNTSNISFPQLQAEAILLLLSENGICASAGAACSSGSLEPSHVLLAMGMDVARAHGGVRFSLSRFNTEKEVDEVLDVLPGLIARLAGLSRSVETR